MAKAPRRTDNRGVEVVSPCSLVLCRGGRLDPPFSRLTRKAESDCPRSRSRLRAPEKEALDRCLPPTMDERSSFEDVVVA